MFETPNEPTSLSSLLLSCHWEFIESPSTTLHILSSRKYFILNISQTLAYLKIFRTCPIIPNTWCVYLPTFGVVNLEVGKFVDKYTSFKSMAYGFTWFHPLKAQQNSVFSPITLVFLFPFLRVTSLRFRFRGDGGWFRLVMFYVSTPWSHHRFCAAAEPPSPMGSNEIPSDFLGHQTGTSTSISGSSSCSSIVCLDWSKRSKAPARKTRENFAR